MFQDRSDAGRQLAEALEKYKDGPVVVYALPRGGVVLGVEIARALHAPLDLIIVRKIGHPLSPEYAIGAIAEDGYRVVNPVEAERLDRDWLDQAAAEELREARRRRELYLRERKPVAVEGRIAIIVDDGLATGMTMQAAIHEVRRRNPGKIVVAVPVAAADTAARLRPDVDELVALWIPSGWFGAIGAFYRDFDQVRDAEVIALLEAAAAT